MRHSMRKILFIINPVAGQGKGKNLIKAINDYMEHKEVAYEIKISNRLGNITEIAKKHVKRTSQTLW